MINVDELDFLARSIDRYTDEELAKFQCMTSTREHWDMQTLINLSFSCEQVSVITDFAKLEEAGRNHYMTVHGGGVPVEEYHQLNGIGIARGLIADGGGRITPYGVVFENAMRIDPVYDGHSFPPYMDQPYLMEFTLETPLEGEITFFLPQPEKRLERLLERGGYRLSPLPESFAPALQEYDWPGNIRELDALLQRYALLLGTREHDFALWMQILQELRMRQQELMPRDAADAGANASGEGTLRERMERVEAAILRETLRRFGGSRKKVATALDLSLNTLWRKMRQHHLV